MISERITIVRFISFDYGYGITFWFRGLGEQHNVADALYNKHAPALRFWKKTDYREPPYGPNCMLTQLRATGKLMGLGAIVADATYNKSLVL